MADTATFDQIMEALQFDELPEDEQEAFLLELNDLVFRGTMSRLIAGMDEGTKDAFMELLEKDATEEELEAFLKERVPDADLAAQETIQDITDDILSVTKQ